MYDEFIGINFPEQLEFSKQFRNFTKKIMAADYKLNNSNMSDEEEINYKLKYIKKMADSFLIAHKSEFGKINWEVNLDKFEKFTMRNNYFRK